MMQVFLIDKHDLVRSGLKLILETADDIVVCGEAVSVDEAFESLSKLKPDLIILDLSEDMDSAVHTMDQLNEASPESRILGLTGNVDQRIHEMAIKSGANGVLLTYEKSSTLLTAVRKVCEGEAWINRSLAAKLLGRSDGPSRDSGEIRIMSLTRRELEIVKLVAIGLGNNEIAERLKIAEKTVRNHLTVVYSKLQVTNRLELALHAVQRGIN